MIKKLVLRYSNLIVSRWIIVLIDLALLNGALLFAILLRFDFDYYQVQQFKVGYQLLAITIFGVLSLLLTGSHRGLIRHTSQVDAIRVVKAVSLTVLLLAILNYAIDLLKLESFPLNWLHNAYPRIIPNSVLMIFYPVALFFLLAFRMVIKLVFYNLTIHEKIHRQKVLVYGAGEVGIGVKNALNLMPNSPYAVAGFIDDNPQKRGKSIQGINVYNPATVNREFILRFRIREIIIALPNIEASRKAEILNHLITLPVTIKEIPPIEHWVNGELSVKQIRNIKIEELLQRDPIELDRQPVLSDVYGKTVMVTGAAGSIGSELARQLVHYKPSRLILVDQAETPLFELQQELRKLRKRLEDTRFHSHVELEFVMADVSDRPAVERILKEFTPRIIYHAAAYKHVPLMEAHPQEAIRVNVFGTRNLAELASQYGAEKFIMISTDKAVNPTSVMGASKRVAEICIQSLQSRPGNHTRFITTRFGNVLGSNGSVTRIFQQQIAAGGPVTVTHPEVIRYFMTIPEACQLVFEAGAMGHGGEIFIFDMGQPVKIVDLARNMIRLSGFDPDNSIRIEFTGLRPGEKLFEELLLDKETSLPTHHPKILIARVNEYTYPVAQKQLDALSMAYDTRNPMALVGQIKRILPNYISNNSVFQELDK